MMQQPQFAKPASPRPTNTDMLAGWDIGIAAFALACMTAGYWRLWPGALSLADAPLAALIPKAGLAALGFVAIATRWEDTLKALAGNPLILVLLALACCSAIWAIVPADALRSSILLILVWVFGIALSLRFRAREFAEICGFAGLFGLIAQFAAHQSMPPVSAFDGDVVFAIMGTAWAAWCVPARRSLWLLALGGSSALAFAAADLPSLGAIIGMIIGLGVAKVSAIRGKQGTISVIITAWVLVALIIGVTLFAMFGADPLSARISSFFGGLGANMVIGQGFGAAGHSVAGALGAGLGVVGVVLVGLIVFASLFQMLLGDRQQGTTVDGSVAIWFGALGAILVSPADIAILGPVCILFAATTFSISLSRVVAPRRRRSLVIDQIKGPAMLSSRPNARPNALAGAPVVPPTPSLNAMGLRPRS